MYNPFEKSDALFYVLQNDALQYSLWPSYVTVPGGWQIVFGPEQKEACDTFVETHWPSFIQQS
ncbi:MbtH family protein [Kurthia massiliensis]|uniref:MbtH family protein n=1 Tax=Kurthia massiliensis TaxID=1033739 RepID=UPI00028966DE|nr:MbtH family protein [Kurthia massiliensis]